MTRKTVAIDQNHVTNGPVKSMVTHRHDQFHPGIRFKTFDQMFRKDTEFFDNSKDLYGDMCERYSTEFLRDPKYTFRMRSKPLEAGDIHHKLSNVEITDMYGVKYDFSKIEDKAIQKKLEQLILKYESLVAKK